MPGYTKLFASIIHSTIWREENHIRLTFITMLAMADKYGIIEASIPGLADAARVSISECEEALSYLMAPDPYSRSQECEGRRIEELQGGWGLINHAKYRDMMSEEDKRRQNAERQARYRAKHKSNAESNAGVTQDNAGVTESNTSNAGVTQDNAGVTESNTSNAGVTQDNAGVTESNANNTIQNQNQIQNHIQIQKKEEKEDKEGGNCTQSRAKRASGTARDENVNNKKEKKSKKKKPKEFKFIIEGKPVEPPKGFNTRQMQMWDALRVATFYIPGHGEMTAWQAVADPIRLAAQLGGDAYPGVDSALIHRLGNWTMENRKRAKKEVAKFLINRFSSSQERGSITAQNNKQPNPKQHIDLEDRVARMNNGD